MNNETTSDIFDELFFKLSTAWDGDPFKTYNLGSWRSPIAQVARQKSELEISLQNLYLQEELIRC